jgi:glutamate N-acetyltransferase / amino-acid N-acetyltransferase
MSITAVPGFVAAGVACGIKDSGESDLALVATADGAPVPAAGVFTQNLVVAAPVVVSRRHLAATGGRAAAVVLSSGNANAATGEQGEADAETMCALSAAGVGCTPDEVLVCSTGLIGYPLPMDALAAGIPAAAAARGGAAAHGAAAAEAIMTTDTRAKTTEQAGDGYTVGGMAKGAGMLAPAMATMLCVLTTDAVADPATLDVALREACRITFDRIDSDGCMSTNDTVLLLASGASGINPSAEELTATVTAACHDLARQLLADAEGATKDIAIEVTGAASEDDAVEVGRAIARSSLVKCAFFGNDPNWGRIIAAIGTTAAAFDPDEVDVAVNGVPVCRGGAAGDDRSKVDLIGRAVHVLVDLHAGAETATVWTNDLSIGYVHENSAYSS